MEKKKLYWVVGGLGLIGIFWYMMKSKKPSAPTQAQLDEIERLNQMASQNDAERKKLLDDLYVSFSQNQIAEPKVIYNLYNCALEDVKQMSNDEISKLIAFKSKNVSEIVANPLEAKMYMELNSKYPKAFRDNPCDTSEKKPI